VELQFIRFQSGSDLYIQPEAALRLPGVILALSRQFLSTWSPPSCSARSSFHCRGLVAFDPNAIGFNRIAKEDTFLLFFFSWRMSSGFVPTDR